MAPSDYLMLALLSLLVLSLGLKSQAAEREIDGLKLRVKSLESRPVPYRGNGSGEGYLTREFSGLDGRYDGKMTSLGGHWEGGWR